MDKYSFFPVPLALWDVDPYKSLSFECKIVLSVIIQLDALERWRESPQTDDYGAVYVTFSQAEVAELVGCGGDKAGKILRGLETSRCIKRKHQGQGKSDKIYLNELVFGPVRDETGKIIVPYIPLPLAFWDPQKTYNTLSIAAKLVLGNLMRLEGIARWDKRPQKDRDGVVYVTFSLSQLKQLVGCGEDRAGKICKELTDSGCIRMVRQGQGLSNRIYINVLVLNTIKSGKHRTHCSLPMDPAECRVLLERQVRYETLTAEFGVAVVDAIVKTIVDELQSKNERVEIGGNTYDRSYYRQRLLSTREEDVRYVIRRLDKLGERPYCPARYIVTRLWESYNCAPLCRDDSVGNQSRRQDVVRPSGELGEAELEAIQAVLRMPAGLF